MKTVESNKSKRSGTLGRIDSESMNETAWLGQPGTIPEWGNGISGRCGGPSDASPGPGGIFKGRRLFYNT
jgi:hypothetical protein